MARPLADLHAALAERSERLFKPKFTVSPGASRLRPIHRAEWHRESGFRSRFTHRALVRRRCLGRPSCNSNRTPYSMTATVIQDAELGFWRPAPLYSLLSSHPDFCEQLLLILGDKAASTQRTQKALLRGDRRQPPRFRVVEREFRESAYGCND